MMKVSFLFIAMVYLNLASAKQIDTLGNLNPANFNTDFTAYSQKTAVYLAQLSDLSYAKDMNVFYNFVNRYMQSYPGVLLRSEIFNEKSKDTDTQILLWATKEFTVIAFRGTEITKRNIITDLKYHNYEFTTPEIRQQYFNLPSGHAGFRKAIINLLDKTDILGRIETLLKQTYPGKDIKQIPVYLTGHSLGGSLASMFAEPLSVNNYAIKGLYLFAPALAISCTDVEMMEKNFGTVTYNIVNYKDYIPRAGLRGTLAHYGKFYRICKDSTLSREPERYVKMKLFEKKNVYTYHKLETYINLLDLSQNSSVNVSSRQNNCFSELKVIMPCVNN